MCLAYYITEAYLVRVIPSAGLHEIIEQPVLFAFCGLLCQEILIFLKVVLSINVIDCSTNVV